MGRALIITDEASTSDVRSMKQINWNSTFAGMLECFEFGVAIQV